MFPNQEQLFNRMYQENFWKLRRYALIFLNENQSEEIVQDTFYEAAQKIELLLEHDSPDGWLMNTLKNKIRNCQRQNQKDLLRLVSLDSEIALQVATPENAEDIIERDETLAEFSQKITEALSPEDLHLLRRIAFEKASHKEVSSELGITVWGSQKRLERIRDRLSKIFPGHRK